MTGEDLKTLLNEFKDTFEPFRYDEALSKLDSQDFWSLLLVYEIRQVRKAIEAAGKTLQESK